MKSLIKEYGIEMLLVALCVVLFERAGALCMKLGTKLSKCALKIQVWMSHHY